MRGGRNKIGGRIDKNLTSCGMKKRVPMRAISLREDRLLFSLRKHELKWTSAGPKMKVPTNRLTA
jgi:hypothetical protein